MLLKQSSTAQPLLFQLIDTSDHIAGKTGASPTVTLSKNGGAFASPAGAVTEISAGWYKVAGNATDTGTLGPLVLHATASGADPVDVVFNVVAYDPQDAVHLGLSALPNVASGSAGAIPTTGTGANQIAVNNVGAIISVVDVTGSIGGNVGGKVLGGGDSTILDVGSWVLDGAGNPIADAVSKTGYELAATGLDAITVTAPTGVASTFPQMLVQLWRRFFRKSTLTATQLKTYGDDGTTVVTTQAVSDDDTTQTQGTAA